MTFEDSSVYILSACRTPLGCFQGGLSSLSSADLGAVVFKEAVKRAGIPASDISEAFLGNVLQAGGRQNPCRQALINAGLPESIVCSSINQVCASGLKAITLGAQSIMLGQADVVLAGGAESMTNAPYLLPKARAGLRMGNAEIIDSMINDGLWDPFTNQHMGLNTETTAEEFSITREEQDNYSELSYNRAKSYWELEEHPEIVSVVPTARGASDVSIDEQYTKANFSKMRSLKPCFKKDGSITPANASAIADGAAAVVLVSGKYAREHGLAPIAKVVAFADTARDPLHFTIAPTDASNLTLKRAGLEKSDVDLWEINEAFAAVVLANVKLLGLESLDSVNVSGGGISLGHPLGASGCVRSVALIHELKRTGKKRGLVTCCVGGGQAGACLFEVL
ncbi:hypothetical protein RCL1_005041 [Eukaryota sp. TZLM3-RCL]